MEGLEALRGTGRRLTPQRRLVYSALLEQPGHATADELCAAIGRRVPGIQRTTVYRTLELLVGMGLARPVRLGRSTSYEAVREGTESHQHLICDQCGQTFDLSCPEVPAWVGQAAAPMGFRVGRVELLGHGSCSECGEAND